MPFFTALTTSRGIHGLRISFRNLGGGFLFKSKIYTFFCAHVKIETPKVSHFLLIIQEISLRRSHKQETNQHAAASTDAQPATAHRHAHGRGALQRRPEGSPNVTFFFEFYFIFKFLKNFISLVSSIQYIN